MATTPFFFGTPKHGLAQLTTSSGTSYATVVSGGSSGSKIVSLGCVSESTVAQLITVAIQRSAVTYVKGAATVAVTAGTDGSTPVADLLSATLMPDLAVDNDGQKYLFLESGDALVVKTAVTVPAGRVLHLHSDRGDG